MPQITHVQKNTYYNTQIAAHMHTCTYTEDRNIMCSHGKQHHFMFMCKSTERETGTFSVFPPHPACCSLRLTALRFKTRCCTQLPAQDFLIRVGDLASALPRNKSQSLSGAFPPALLSGISLSALWLSSPDIFIQERKKKIETRLWLSKVNTF